MSTRISPTQTGGVTELPIIRKVTQSDLNMIVLTRVDADTDQTQEAKADFIERCTKWGSVVSMTLSPAFLAWTETDQSMPIDGFFAPVPGLDIKVEQSEESITVAAGSYKTTHSKWSMGPQNNAYQTLTIELDLWTQGAGANVLMIKSKIESKMADPGMATGSIIEYELIAE